MRWSFVLIAAGCKAAVPGAPDAGDDAIADARPPADVTITAELASARTTTREHMIAGGEMQISGEPLAEAMGRDLGGYSRDLLPPDLYLDHQSGLFWIDLPGFSTGVESYEYSKQPMNALAFESGAGTALGDAPAIGDLTARVQHFALGSNATGKWVFAPGTFPADNAYGDLNPTGTGVPANNPLGWPGIWPTAHVFASFDPSSDPSDRVDLQCSIVSDDNPSEAAAPLISADYECDASSLHLRDRDQQVEKIITPGADGWSGWKYGLWTINYLQIMHDAMNQAVEAVPEAELAQVGAPGASVFLGSSDIEGFQAQMFVTMLDVRADDWLAHLSTTDGKTLDGFASVSAALAYDYDAPLRTFPRIAVTESDDGTPFPLPSYAIADPDPDLLDDLGVIMAYSEAYALTDRMNPDVGGSQPVRAFFDGDPFAADDGVPDGEDTLHDRALAMMRVAFIDLDRAGTGAPVSTTDAAYTVIALRTMLRALSSQLTLYSNNTPDTAIASTPLDLFPIHHPSGAGVSFTARAQQLLRANAELLMTRTEDPADFDLDGHAAAIHGLFAAYLATGDTTYRARAIAMWQRMDATFWDPDARIYLLSPAARDAVEYTPLRFALVQSALRDVYELVAARPGGEALAPIVEARLARMDTLVLNGWDDRDRDKHVAWPDECVRVEGGLPRGGLQLAERTLTGETGRLRDEGGGPGGPPTSDRDQDCVPEIDDAHVGAGLADAVLFRIHR
ncbi:MAG TPA: hypothetical protein VL463_20605 [Kofleriaceae bacterium]|nr:hypothetical protein [Kofleriaceae bacterium]